ncbi:MAG TPA: GSU2403 family nucleotidyltransferase fold protein [Syntrophobacteraceae bacterium]|nr:GSU2403 family nucleotidyltransferase fold protein [Syntrophobacteraceae bacterium]
MVYEGFGLKIELLSPDKRKGVPDGRINIDKLKMASLALRYLNILLDNPISISIRQVGKISVRSLSAFFIHKLLVAPLRREVDRKEKDHMQVNLVAKRILQQDDSTSELSRTLGRLPYGWKKRIRASASVMKKILPPSEPDAVLVLLSRVLV